MRGHILDPASGAILSSFGRPGHQLGSFTHGHSLAIDTCGNLYVAETNWGRRVNKFRLVGEAGNPLPASQSGGMGMPPYGWRRRHQSTSR